MAAFPGSRAPDMAKKELEASYSAALREFEPQEIQSLMTPHEAFVVDEAANKKLDVLKADISPEALALRMNRAVYDDEAEDYIAESDALIELIKLSRLDASHEGAERVRLLRSARYLLFLANRDERQEAS